MQIQRTFVGQENAPAPGAEKAKGRRKTKRPAPKTILDQDIPTVWFKTAWEKIASRASRAFGLEQSDFNFGFGGGLPVYHPFSQRLPFSLAQLRFRVTWNLQPGHSLRPEPCRGMSSTPGSSTFLCPSCPSRVRSTSGMME